MLTLAFPSFSLEAQPSQKTTVESTPEYVEVIVPVQIPVLEKQDDWYDIDKLAYAVAMAETGDCTKGIGPRTNNCFGIMTWENGYKEPKQYGSKEESYADFKRIWSTYYKKFPNSALASKWTGNDSPDIWLNAVNQYYQ